MAGNWQFFGRRWLNPSDPNDREILEQRYHTLCADFPAFKCCLKDSFFSTLACVITSWSSQLNNTARGRSAVAKARPRTRTRKQSGKDPASGNDGKRPHGATGGTAAAQARSPPMRLPCIPLRDLLFVSLQTNTCTHFFQRATHAAQCFAPFGKPKDSHDVNKSAHTCTRSN